MGSVQCTQEWGVSAVRPEPRKQAPDQKKEADSKKPGAGKGINPQSPLPRKQGKLKWKDEQGTFCLPDSPVVYMLPGQSHYYPCTEVETDWERLQRLVGVRVSVISKP